MTIFDSAFKVFEYFDITYIENPGMAFGLTIVNKLFLSLFTQSLFPEQSSRPLQPVADMGNG